jgi:diguanylate cyclase (GGDEF)-like protein
MWPWQLQSTLQTSDLFADLVVLLAAIFFGIALLRLYNAYGRPRILLVMIAGIGFFIIAAPLDILLVTSFLKWQALWTIDNAIVSAGTILSAVSMVVILHYLLEAAKIDHLTSVYNRRHFKEVLDIEIARSIRNNLEFTLLYCDIDNFKQINDRMGHTIGDVALRHIAQRLNSNVRASDVIARWGGDEFVILFPQTDIQTTKIMMERLNEEVGSMALAGRQLSISSGMASFPNDGDNADRLLSLADTRMYHNKDVKIELNHLAKENWERNSGHGHLKK